MIPYIDCSPGQLQNLMKLHDLPMRQLASPLTKNLHNDDVLFIYDNGGYTRDPIQNRHWRPEIKQMKKNCQFIVMPDVLGNWKKTLARFHRHKYRIDQGKRMIVLQDGATAVDILEIESEIGGVFIGGTTDWKITEGRKIAIELRESSKLWIHVGRVNTINRIHMFHGYAHSFDGSGLVRFGMLRDLVPRLKQLNKSKQYCLRSWIN
jgi:hypothetical protein